MMHVLARQRQAERPGPAPALRPQAAPLQAIADASPVVSSLRALQRAAARPPIQRKLGYLRTIDEADVASVTELKQGAVFRLNPAMPGARSLIIRAEVFQLSEGRDAYTARHGATNRLARRVLAAAPGVRPVSDAEQQTLLGLTVPGAQALKVLPLATTAWFKAETVDAGLSVGILDPLASDVVDPNEQAKQRARLGSVVVQKELGRMALVDLVVGNEDRFRSDAVVNLDNLDLNAAGPVAIDNVDPGGRLDGGWDAARWCASEGQMRAYARRVVARILTRAGLLSGDADADDTTRVIFELFFADGMLDAAAKLRAGQKARWKASRGAVGEDRVAIEALWRRINKIGI